MKKFILLSLFCLMMISTAYSQMSSKVDVKDAITSKEKAMWEAVKNGETDMFKTNLDASYMGIYETGIVNMDQELQDIAKVKLNSYEMMDVNVMQPTNDVAIITYTANADGSYMDKPFTGKLYATSTWVLKDGQWRGVLHTETRSMPENMEDKEE